MSFPVLQRMDRKRPEMIQPISWKAEAMKGLAQGLQVGMQMANTINAIQLRRAENARAEQAHALITQLVQEQVKQAKLLNQEREIDSQLKSLYLQGETNYQLQQQSISANGLLFDYTTGISRLQRWMEDTGQDAQPVPSGINEALRSGYIQRLVLDAPSVMNSIADPGASVADKFVAYSDFKDKANPFFGPLKSAAMRLDPKHPVFTAASTLLPFENQTTLWDNTTMTILANVNRSEDENRAIFAGLPVKDQDGKDILPQQAMAEQRPVQVKINSVIGGLRRGHFIEDMANEIAGASNPEPFMNYLKGTVPKTHYDKLAARVDALREKTAEVKQTIPKPQESFLLSDDRTALDTVAPVERLEKVETKKVGDRTVEITTPRNIFDDVMDGIVSAKNWLVDKITSDSEEDILNEISSIADLAARQHKDYSSRMLARHSVLKREFYSLKIAQAEAAADPATKYDAKKYARIIDKLGKQIIKIEKAHNIQDVSDSSVETQAATKPDATTAQASAPATAGAGTKTIGYVAMRAPDGSIRNVRADQVEEAKRRGAVVVE